MNAKDVKHVSNDYINAQDFSGFMTTKNIRGIKQAYANVMISRTTTQLKKLAEPQESGNAKRVMWFYLARNGFVEIPPKHYCQVSQSNPPQKDIKLKGLYVRRCRCGNRPFVDRCPGYSWWISCSCGMQGHNGNYKEQAIKNWNKEDVFYNA